jgi:Meckelin (Transmembrane protein 67)
MAPVTASDASTFLTAILLIYSISFIHVFKSLLKQTKADLFLIDWEQSKTSSADYEYEQPKPIPVSVWRSIFMSNEWAALQTYRYCNVEFTLLAVLVLLEGTYLGSFQDLLVVPDGSGSMHPILIFCIDAICWLVVIAAQVIISF